MSAPAALPGPAQMDAIANRGSLFVEFGRQDEAQQAMEAAARSLSEFAGHPVRVKRSCGVSGRTIR